MLTLRSRMLATSYNLCVVVGIGLVVLGQSDFATAAASDGDRQRAADITTGNADQDSKASDGQGKDSDVAAHKKKKKGSKKETDAKAKHPTLTVGNAFSMELTGRIEGGVRAAAPTIGLDSAQPEWQDRRVGVKGTAFKRISFEVSRELGQDFETSTGLSEKTAWRDVFVRARLAKALNVQAGHFKMPFGYEELTGETDLDFIYRSLAARVLSPGRDTGVMIDGRVGGRRAEYQIGYFTRDGENGRTSQTEGGRDAVAIHVALAPFASNNGGGFHVGASASRSRLDDNLGLRGRTVLGDGIFFDRSFVNGYRQRVGFETSLAAGPVSASGEYIWDVDERLGMGFDGEDLPSIRGSAWYFAGTWALTGERKHGRLDPRHDFLNGGLGAVELVGRYEMLQFDDATYPGLPYGFPSFSKLAGNADRVTTLGLNWYANQYLKVQGDLIVETIADPPRSPAPSANGRFASAVLRFQIRL